MTHGLERLAIGVVGLLACYLASGDLRRHVTATVADMRGGQPWERATHKRILGQILASQMKGYGEEGYWISFVEGLSVMPAGTAAERRDTFSRAATDLPTKSDTWFPSSAQLDFWYLRFLTSLGEDAERRRDFDKDASATWQAVKEDLRRQGIGVNQGTERQWSNLLDKTAKLFARTPQLNEISAALNTALLFKSMNGSLRDALYTDPAHDLETATANLGSILYSYSATSSPGQVFSNDQRKSNSIDVQIETTYEIREFTIKRPWLDDTLLDRYRKSTRLNGEQFFGEGGRLHLVPTHVIVRSEPIYVIPIDPTNRGTIVKLMEASQCCTLKVAGQPRQIDSSSAVLYPSALVGRDAALRPELFAVISRIR